MTDLYAQEFEARPLTDRENTDQDLILANPEGFVLPGVPEVGNVAMRLAVEIDTASTYKGSEPGELSTRFNQERLTVVHFSEVMRTVYEEMGFGDKEDEDYIINEDRVEALLITAALHDLENYFDPDGLVPFRGTAHTVGMLIKNHIEVKNRAVSDAADGIELMTFRTGKQSYVDYNDEVNRNNDVVYGKVADQNHNLFDPKHGSYKFNPYQPLDPGPNSEYRKGFKTLLRRAEYASNLQVFARSIAGIREPKKAEMFKRDLYHKLNHSPGAVIGETGQLIGMHAIPFDQIHEYSAAIHYADQGVDVDDVAVNEEFVDYALNPPEIVPTDEDSSSEKKLKWLV